MPRMLVRTGILVALLAPAMVFAAHDDVTMTTNTVLSIGGITLNVSGTTAEVESITVNATNFSVVLPADSSFQVTAPGLEQLNANTATGQTSYVCSSSQSLIGYAPSVTETVTITPSPTLCSSTADTSGGSSTTISTGSSSGSSSGSSATSATPTTPATPTVTSATPTTPATPASGLSTSQIQSILDVLTSFDVDATTMASVRAALEGTTTGSVTSAAVSVFKSDLTVGSLGSEVKALQEYLNSHGYTIANSGAGSIGNETTRFGSLTKTALIKYQKAKGITPAVGYFGSKTRASINSGE